MKTRYGLVSNSSSASFLIIGTLHNWDFNAINEENIKDGIYVVGRTLCGGKDVFQIANKEMLDFVKENSDLFHRAYTNAKGWYDPSIEMICEEWMVGKSIAVIHADQNSSYSMKELKRNYIGEED